MCVPDAHKGQDRMLMVGSHCVYAENHTQVLCKSNVVLLTSEPSPQDDLLLRGSWFIQWSFQSEQCDIVSHLFEVLPTRGLYAAKCY